MRPHSGVAIGLELEADGKLIGLGGIGLLRLPHARIGAEHVLNVVAELVRHDIGTREVASCSEATFQLIEKTEIEVNSLVEGAVERPHRRLGWPAPRIGG